MRSKTNDEKEFNKLAKKHGLKAFSAQQFDRDPALQEAFQSYLECRNFTLNDDLSNIAEMPKYEYLSFLSHDSTWMSAYDEEGNLTTYTFNEYIENTAKLFSISHEPAVKDIACEAYSETYTNGYFVDRDENGEKFANESIAKKIEKLQEFQNNLIKAIKFIQKRYPRWDKAAKQEKDEIIDDINKLTELLPDSKILNIASFIVTNYRRLNAKTKLFALILLHLDLPYIDNPTIAMKIAKNL